MKHLRKFVFQLGNNSTWISKSESDRYRLPSHDSLFQFEIGDRCRQQVWPSTTRVEHKPHSRWIIGKEVGCMKTANVYKSNIDGCTSHFHCRSYRCKDDISLFFLFNIPCTLLFNISLNWLVSDIVCYMP